MRRCYVCNEREAVYEARLDWTEGTMLLCVECADDERGWWQSVLEIHTLKETQDAS